MKIFVKAKPNAKEERVEKIDFAHFVVSVKEPPVQGRVNKAIVRAIAEFFGVSGSRVNIVSGHTSRSKLIDISD
ncbi:MAG: DUF167 domain-containing protein [Patescibacteria group bacterium]